MSEVEDREVVVSGAAEGETVEAQTAADDTKADQSAAGETAADRPAADREAGVGTAADQTDAAGDADETDAGETGSGRAGADQVTRDETGGENVAAAVRVPPPRAKVKMPDARNLGRPDFTPHALGAKGRAAPRSGTRAAAKRRRILYTTGGVVVFALLVAVMVWYETRPAPSVKVTGAFGKAPSVSVPKAQPAPKKQVKVLIPGVGATVGKNDIVVARFVAWQWTAKGGKELRNTFKTPQPALRPAGQLTGLQPLDDQVVGRRVGTRIEVTLPYKDVGVEIAQALQLGKADDLVVALDVLQAYGKTSSAQGTPRNIDDPTLPTVTAGAPGTAPAVKIPAKPAPGELRVETLIQGDGPAVAKNQTLIAQYHGVLWRDGKVFDSTWQRGAPATFPIGAGQVIPGWEKGLVGKKAGSRVLLVVPPKEGYGSKGSPDGTIKGTDTLVFVVDILGSY